MDTVPIDFKHHPCAFTNSLSVNATKSFDNFHISYDPTTRNYKSITTAIVLENHVFLVLNGNHSFALNQIAGHSGLVGCVDYFIEHIEQANPFSEHLNITGKSPDIFGLTKVAIKVLGQANIDRIAEACDLLNTKA